MMAANKDTWTSTHDLGLIFIALAYGTDQVLADAELDAIVDALKRWNPDMSEESAKEVVMEAISVYIASDVSKEVVQSIHSLKRVLSEDARRRALEDVVRIAKSDGILLGSERSLISVLANAWQIKEAGGMLNDTSLSAAGADGWTLMHDIALLYVAMAHGGDNQITEVEIGAMIDRMNQWQPELDEQGVRAILRRALKRYSDESTDKLVSATVAAVKTAFPVPQRLAVLDDLIHIAGVDGNLNRHEAGIIDSLSRAWDVEVRFQETGPS